MASFDQVRNDYRAYAQELKDQRDQAIAAAQTAQGQASQLASDLQAFQDNDAATDATQLAEQSQTLADQLQSDLDALKAAPEPVEPTVEPTPEPDQPPADETPADQPPAGRKRR